MCIQGLFILQSLYGTDISGTTRLYIESNPYSQVITNIIHHKFDFINEGITVNYSVPRCTINCSHNFFKNWEATENLTKNDHFFYILWTKTAKRR